MCGDGLALSGIIVIIYNSRLYYLTTINIEFREFNPIIGEPNM
jgi:hypothetical protein